MSEDAFPKDRFDTIPSMPIPELYKLLKNDDLIRQEIELIEQIALTDGTDYEDENVQKMVGAIKSAKDRCAAREESLRLFMRGETIKRAKEYLKEAGVPNIDDIPEDALVEIGDGLNLNYAFEHGVYPADQQYIQVIEQDDDLGVWVTSSGEVIGFTDANENKDVRLVLEWMGEKRERLAAKLAGITAERKHWSDRIAKVYDPQVNRLTRALAYLEKTYEPTAQAYLDEVRRMFLESERGKKKPDDVPKSVKVGLLILSYTKDREKVEVVDEDKAIATLKKLKATDAIKTTESILKSNIPIAIKAKLVKEKLEEQGLYFYPGGTPQFSFK